MNRGAVQGFQAVVTGRVQGVGFRWFVQQHAARLRLTGYARNLPNGDVEVVARGDEPHLQALIGELKRGPGMSRVEGVHVTWTADLPDYRDFGIRF